MSCSRPGACLVEAEFDVQLYDDERLYAKIRKKVIVMPKATRKRGRVQRAGKDMDMDDERD